MKIKNKKLRTKYKKFKFFIYRLRRLIPNFIKYGTNDIFDTVEIETLTICNRQCDYCPNKNYPRPKAYMPTELFKKIVDQLAEIKFSDKFHPHFYGEPLLDKRLPELIAYTRKKLPLAKIVIFTSGDFLTKEMFDKLIQAGASGFFVSQHDDEMSLTMKNLFKQLNNKEREKILYRILKDGDIPLTNRGGLVKVENKKPVMKKCIMPSDRLTIDYKGKVVLCCNDYFSKYTFGDLNTERLMDIWRRNAFKKIRKDLRHGIFNLEICKNCF